MKDLKLKRSGSSKQSISDKAKTPPAVSPKPPRGKAGSAGKKSGSAGRKSGSKVNQAVAQLERNDNEIQHVNENGRPATGRQENGRQETDKQENGRVENGGQHIVKLEKRDSGGVITPPVGGGKSRLTSPSSGKIPKVPGEHSVNVTEKQDKLQGVKHNHVLSSKSVDSWSVKSQNTEITQLNASVVGFTPTGTKRTDSLATKQEDALSLKSSRSGGSAKSRESSKVSSRIGSATSQKVSSVSTDVIVDMSSGHETSDCVIDIPPPSLDEDDPLKPVGNVPGTVLTKEDEEKDAVDLHDEAIQTDLKLLRLKLNRLQGSGQQDHDVQSVKSVKSTKSKDSGSLGVTSDEAGVASPVGGIPPQPKPELEKPLIEVTSPKSPMAKSAADLKDAKKAPKSASNKESINDTDKPPNTNNDKTPSKSQQQKNNEATDKKPLDAASTLTAGAPVTGEKSDKESSKAEVLNTPAGTQVNNKGNSNKSLSTTKPITDSSRPTSARSADGSTKEKNKDKDKGDVNKNKTTTKDESKPMKAVKDSKSTKQKVPGKAVKKGEKTNMVPQPIDTGVMEPSTSAQEKWRLLKGRQKDILMMASPRANGTRPGLSRTESLTVPGTETPGARRDSSSQNSLRRGSSRSIDSRLSSIDLTKIAATIDDGDEKDKDVRKRGELTASSDNYLKNAIPYLPVPVAVLLLMCNMILPGLGTMLSGVCVLCCGRPRVQTKDDHVMQTVCINMWVGLAQLFTVTFMLVGWVWSFSWGIYMVILSVEKQKEVKAHRQKELQAKALTALNSQIRPWTLRT